MLKVVRKLFQERTNIINKQAVLANNLNNKYRQNNTPNSLRDYKKVEEYQKQISDKERQIYQVIIKK